MLLGTSTGYASADSNLIKDRLGSKNPSYPYGTDIGTQAGEGDDFATYWKDNSSGFQYAMNRYYAAGYGRFLTADPFGGSAKTALPVTWNRYAYTIGDPVNLTDRTGLDDSTDFGEFTGCQIGSGDGSGFSFIGAGGPGGAGGNVMIGVDCAGVLPVIPIQMWGGDGGGGGNCGTNGGDPGCAQVGAPPCRVTLFAVAAGNAADPFDHTYLEVNSGPGQIHFLEGIPVAKNPRHTSPFMDPMWLDGSDENHPAYPHARFDFGLTLFASGAICNALVKSVDDYKKTENGKITSNNKNPWAGPNSNSFTHSLIAADGFLIPDVLNLLLLAYAPGWTNTSVPF